MATKQRIVYGATCEWSSDGSTFESIAEVTGLVIPEVSVDYQDVTNLDSAGGFREFIPGLKDPGEISIPCGYVSATYSTAKGYQTNGTLVTFKTTLPTEEGFDDGDVFEFTGFVSPALETNNVGDPIGLTLNVRVTGNVTFTQGTETV